MEEIKYRIQLSDGQYYSDIPQTWKSVRSVIAQEENGRFNWGLYNRKIKKIIQVKVTEEIMTELSIAQFKAKEGRENDN